MTKQQTLERAAISAGGLASNSAARQKDRMDRARARVAARLERAASPKAVMPKTKAKHVKSSYGSATGGGASPKHTAGAGRAGVDTYGYERSVHDRLRKRVQAERE